MSGLHNVQTIIKTVFDYTPEAVDRLLSVYSNKCEYSAFVECRFNPVKQHFVLEGDMKLTEFAICDFMDLIQKMTREEARKTNKGVEILQRSKPSHLNIIPVRWTEDLTPAPKQRAAIKWGANSVC